MKVRCTVSLNFCLKLTELNNALKILLLGFSIMHTCLYFGSYFRVLLRIFLLHNLIETTNVGWNRHEVGELGNENLVSCLDIHSAKCFPF